MDISNVISWKHNDQAGMATEEGVITEFPGGIPSQADQDTWTTEYEAYVAANAYSGKRKVEYNRLNQLELISDDAIGGTTTHKDAVLAIKSKYPKPE
jgi:hypothetical protein